MRKSLLALTLTGIVFGSIIIVWQLIPLLLLTPLDVTWTPEAQEYRTEWAAKILSETVPIEVVDQVVAEAVTNAEELANQTDYTVHLIDMRLGMALTFWEESQNGSRFDKRYCWNEEFKEMSLNKLTVWERLIEVEAIAEVPENILPIKWDYGAIKYYYNPGDPQFGYPDQPDYMIKVLEASSESATEFHGIMANATAKAEAIVNATDQVVHLDDLKEAMAQILVEWDKYLTIEEALTAIATLEQDP